MERGESREAGTAKDRADAMRAIRREERRSSKKGFVARHAKLRADFISQGWLEHLREISEYIQPRRQRFLFEDRNRAGSKRSNKIINSTATRASRIFASGMMTGASSPARPWFRLVTPSPETMNDQEARRWLQEVEKRVHRLLNASNAYTALPMVYRDLGNCGTAAMFVEEDDRDLMRCYVYPVGSFVLATSSRQEVDTLYHEVGMTVGQIGEKWGMENASPSLKEKWAANNHDEWVRILHCVEPNQDYDPSRVDRMGKRFRSVWLEADCGPEDGPPLFEGNGFNEFPAMCPRWDLNGEDVYGSCPGMEALGEVKGLQAMERAKLNAIAKIVNPPMVGPSSLKSGRPSLLSGDVTYVDVMQGGQKFEPAITIDSRIAFVKEEIAMHETRINQAFYADLFLMLSESDQRQPVTAREIDEKHEEKMLQLGASFQRVHNELLDPLVKRALWILLRAGMLPPAPPSIAGLELMVEPISIMETLQKMMGTSAVERLFGFAAANSGLFPEIVDKLDADKALDDYADMVGAPPDIVVSGDDLLAKRAQRARQAQLAALAAAAKPAKDGALANEAMTRTAAMPPPAPGSGPSLSGPPGGLAGLVLNQGGIQ